MLHLFNGKAAAALHGRAGLPGTALTWDDVLHDGPVPAGLDLAALRLVRATFLASEGWAPFGRVLAELGARDGAVLAAEAGVLWLEHDLYDQLQLLQIVDALAAAGRVTRWRLVQADTYLGPLSPEALAALLPRAAPLVPEAVALARRAWAAFRESDPTALEALLAEPERTALPYLAPALTRWLEELPHTHDGLSRSERQVLQILAQGPRSFRALFLEWSDHEEPRWMGDASLLSRLEALTRAPGLVARQGNAWHLTPTGEAVLARRADWARLGGVRRWHGGLHLDSTRGGAVWRWDAATRRVVAPQ